MIIILNPMIKRKIFAGLLVSINMGFIYTFVIANTTPQKIATIFFSLFVGILTLFLIFTLIIVPIALLFSTVIEIKTRSLRYRKMYSTFLHLLVGIWVGIFIRMFIMQESTLSNTMQLSYWLFYSLYPAVSFYIFDELLRRHNQ